MVMLKEYISVIEGTAPAIVLQKFDSPNLSPLCLQYTALPAHLTEQNKGFARKTDEQIPNPANFCMSH